MALNSLAKLNEPKVRLLLRLRREGHSIKVLAEQFGMSREAVYQVFRGDTWSWIGGTRRALAPVGRPKLLDDEDVAELRNFRAIGVPFHFLMRRYGITRSTAYAAISGLGVYAKNDERPEVEDPPDWNTPEGLEEMKRRRSLGASLSSLGRAFGCSRGTIEKRLGHKPQPRIFRKEKRARPLRSRKQEPKTNNASADIRR